MTGFSLNALRRSPRDRERPDAQPDAPSGSQVQRRGLARTVGRWVVWLFIGIVIIRGLSATFGGADPPPVAKPAASGDERFPDPEARTFASQFARGYLTFRPGREESYGHRIGPYLAPSIRDEATIQLATRGASQGVSAVSVARVETVGKDQALVTVAANVVRTKPARTIHRGRGKRRRTHTIPATQSTATDYLTVPIYRDRRGGLSVYDLPAFTAPPARAADFTADTSQLQGSSADTSAINDLVRKFLAVYLGGSPDQLTFYTPPKVRITPLGGALTLHRVEEVQQVGDGAGRNRKLLVQASVRDPDTRTIYPMRYRLDVVRRDRWLVRAVDGGGGP